MNKRIAWIDVARGIGIILVVYGHILRGLFHSGIVPAGNGLSLSDYSIYTFHMPLFFFLAGLNVTRSLQKGTGRFLQSKLWTIAYPYFLWSIIQGSVEIALASHLNMPVSRHDLLMIWRTPIKQFWFLYFLFFFHAVAAFTATRPKLSWLMWGSAFALAFFIHFSNGWYHPYVYTFLFYEAGVILDTHVLATVEKLKAVSVPVLAGFFILALYFGGRASGYDYTSTYAIPAAILGICLTIAVSKFVCDRSGSLTGVLASLGVASTAIYILHVLAGAGIRVLLKAMGVYNLGIQLSLGLVCGVGIPWAVYFVAARLGIVALVGLGVQPRKDATPGAKLPPGTTIADSRIAAPARG